MPDAEIAHVVMSDRVGYSKLSLTEKQALDQAILEAVETCPAVLGRDETNLLRLDSGDGVSLVFFGDPRPAAEAAMYLHRRVAEGAKVALRIGVHSGPVLRRIDVGGRINVSGPGIEKAQRVMNEADGRAVLVSEFFAENLRGFTEWSGFLTPIGERTVKHGERIRMLCLTGLPADIAHAAVRVDPGASQASPNRRVSVLYKPNSQPDERILATVEEQLRAEGFEVLVDRQRRLDTAWAKEIDRQIRTSDAVVALISKRSMQSEMLGYEIETAISEMELRGKPMILPVLLEDASIPEEWAPMLRGIDPVAWHSAEDDRPLVHAILASLVHGAKKSTPIATPRQPGGAVKLDSPFYIVRPTDALCIEAISAQDGIALVRGPRQVGKTSLLARGMASAKAAGDHTVFVDLQSFGPEEMETDASFYRGLIESIVDQLDLDVDPATLWRDSLGANRNLERFVLRQVLEASEKPVVWAFDEVDRLFTRPYAGSFFGLLRSWFNARGTRPHEPWDRLTLVIAYATEAHLFIADLNQSPFNVGTRIELSDFTLAEVSELNTRYGSPLTGAEVGQVVALLGGHPYLTQRLLFEISTGATLAEVTSGVRENGVFSDHLSRILAGLVADSELTDAVQSVLRGEEKQEEAATSRLIRAGLLVHRARGGLSLRCELYRNFLSDALK